MQGVKSRNAANQLFLNKGLRCIPIDCINIDLPV